MDLDQDKIPFLLAIKFLQVQYKRGANFPNLQICFSVLISITLEVLDENKITILFLLSTFCIQMALPSQVMTQRCLKY